MTRAFKVPISAPSIVKTGGTSLQYLMADGSVTTGGSTTSMNYAQTLGTRQTAISTSGVTIVSVNITTGGNPVQIIVTGDAENSSANGWIKLKLYRGSTAIGNTIHVESSQASENIPYALTVIDTPAAGTYTYSLKTESAASTGNFNFGETDGPVITAMELNTLLPSTNLSLTGTLTADQVLSTNNGNGTNFKVGDDTWIGDVNTANTLSIKGQQSATSGYIKFGGDTNTFGYNGTSLVYGTTVIPAAKTLLVSTDIGSSVQAYDADLAAIAALASGTGLLKNTAGTWSLDTTSYLSTSTASSTYAPLASPSLTGTPLAPTAAVDTNTTQIATTAYVVGQGYLKSSTAASTYQPLDADLTSIAALTGTGLLKNTAGTWSIDTNTYLTTGTASSTYAPINNPTFTGTVTLAADPSSNLQAATKQYVDNVVASINFHESVKYATTGALGTTGNLVGGTITPTYNNGTSGVGATLTIATSSNWTAITIDGQSLTVGDRVLIKDQAAGLQNGIYTVTTVGAIGNTTSFVFTRATDADNSPSAELEGGDFVFVLNGTSNGGYGYVCSNTSAITVGTTAVTYAAFNTGAAIAAGNGLTESTPGTLAIDTAIVPTLSSANTFTTAQTITPATSLTGLTINAATSAKGLIVKANATTPGNLQEWQDSTGTVLTNVESSGRVTSTVGYYTSGKISIGGASWSGGASMLNVWSTGTTSVPLTVRGVASQTGDLQIWQNSAAAMLAKVDASGNVTAASLIKSGGTSSQYLMADGSTKTEVLPDITPLDDISNQFTGTTYRFMPRYQGQQVTISNPFRLLLTINGIIQTVRSAEYVWQSMIAQNGVRVDNDGYIVFPEAVPAGSQFDARLMAGPTTTSVTTTYPFRAVDIVLGG